MDGYSEATCTTSLSTGDNWYSMYYLVMESVASGMGGGQGDGEPRGDLDSGDIDTGADAQTPPSLGGQPGEAVGMWRQECVLMPVPLSYGHFWAQWAPLYSS